MGDYYPTGKKKIELKIEKWTATTINEGKKNALKFIVIIFKSSSHSDSIINVKLSVAIARHSDLKQQTKTKMKWNKVWM